MKITEIIRCIEEIAPLSLQESYDNAGIQVGDKNRETDSALVCLDVTEDVIDEAISQGTHLIISHHPLIFKGIKSITGKNYIERIIVKAIKHDITIYSAHTNLDNAWNGVNFKIAERLGLTDIRILDPLKGKLAKLVTFVPFSHVTCLKDALFSAGAGHIGNYDCCSFQSEGTGSFKAGEGSSPFCGEIGVMHHENESRVEVIVPVLLINPVVNALQANHPYEEPAYDIIILENRWDKMGAGILGSLSESISEIEFLKQIKEVFGIECLKYAGKRGALIKQVAICGGSGSFLIPTAIAANADAFITGEIKYHDYFGNEDHLLLAELGHYESEQYTKELFCDIIQKKFPTFAIHSTLVDTNPINYL